MDDRDKTSIGLAKLGQLVCDDTLSLGVSKKSVDRKKSLLIEYGGVLMVVVRQIEGTSTFKVINDQNIIKAMKDTGTKEIPIVIVDVDDDKNEKILALAFSLQDNNIGAIAQGSIIDILYTNYRCSLGYLSNLFGVSKSWLSKRQTMARNLNDQVKSLVSNGDLNPRSAEEVAKLPGDAQLGFAVKVVNEAMPKDKIAKLVAMHNAPGTSSEIKKMILENPSGVPLAKLAKPVKKRDGADESEKLDNTLKFALDACRVAANKLRGVDLEGRLPAASLLRELDEAAKKVSNVAKMVLRYVSERDGGSPLTGSKSSGVFPQGNVKAKNEN